MTKQAKNRRILVIDDNHAIHEDFQKILTCTVDDGSLNELSADIFGDTHNKPKQEGFLLDSAFQGLEGVEKVKLAVESDAPYAMAFVDVRMPPGIDGIETISKIWKIYPDLQVVVCTAYSDYSWEDMIAKIGQSDRLLLLKKPFDNTEVLQLAYAMTEKWRLLQDSKLRIGDLEDMVESRTSELRISEMLLRQAQKLEAIGQLAAGIAHEINTPTQYIGDNTRYLRDSFADLEKLFQSYAALHAACKKHSFQPALLSEVEAAIQAADAEYTMKEIPNAIAQSLEGLDRVSKIVRAMKEFSHPGRDRKTAIDLNHAIESTITVARNEWKYVAEMKTDFGDGLPPVSCLPGEVNQVILNLLVNAAHAISDVVGDGANGKGTISVSTRLVGGSFEIRITDTGAGIPEKVRSRIFEPFFTTKEVGKGTGQGLAIARSVIVDKHAGSIRFETVEGKGTTFIICLPVGVPEEATARKAA